MKGVSAGSVLFALLLAGLVVLNGQAQEPPEWAEALQPPEAALTDEALERENAELAARGVPARGLTREERLAMAALLESKMKGTITEGELEWLSALVDQSTESATNPGIEAIDAGTYPFTSSTGAALEDMSSGTTLLIGPDSAGNPSAIASIGFDFWFDGTRYRLFSANAYGLMRLGTAAVGAAFANDLANSANVPQIAPYWDYIEVGTNGKVHYKVAGSAPTRKLVVEWLNVQIPRAGGGNPGAGTFQVWLHERTGVIEFVYGSGIASNDANGGYSVGFGSASFYFASVTTSGPSVAYGTANNTQTGAIAAGTKYTFTPNVPTNPSSLTFSAVGATAMTLNWTDNSSNEVGFAIYRSVNGGPAWDFITQTAAGATSSAQSNLNTSTTYTWYVRAVTEGALSTGTTGSQATTAGTMAGTYTVGPSGTYLSLTDAFAALAANGIAGPVVLELQAAYTIGYETFPITIGNTNSSATFPVTVRPEAGATALSITSANTTATIDLNGASGVTIDGRPGGIGSTGQLTIGNTSTSGSALRFVNDAIGNSVQYASLVGVNTSTTEGVVFFSNTSRVLGNDNNTIGSCDIRDGATTPANLVYSAGTASGSAQFNSANSGNTLMYNHIYNFHQASANSQGVNLQAGNTDWTISDNSFYQAASRTGGGTTSAILVNTASPSANEGTLISNNFIGGSAANAGGAPWTHSSSSPRFVGINLASVAGTPASVQGNTIANFSWSAGGTTTAPGIWCGISLTAGFALVGTAAPNTIGGGTGTGSVTVTSVGDGTSTGIWSASPAGALIGNNTIGSITTLGSFGAGFYYASSFVGVQSGGAGYFEVSGNLLGSESTANSINANNTGSQTVTGILGGTTCSHAKISGNTIANLNNNGSGQVRGISTTSYHNAITGNTVRNLTTIGGAGTGLNASALGIALSTSSTGGQLVSQNTVHTLSSAYSSTLARNAAGIYYAGDAAGTNLVERNFVHSLSLATSSTAACIYGIHANGGTTTFQNNMVRLGIDASGAAITTGYDIRGINDDSGTNSFSFNTVYVGGSGVGAGSTNSYAFSSDEWTNVRAFRDNLFVNERSNGAGTGRHVAARYTGNLPDPTGLTSDFNLYLANGTGAALLQNGGNFYTSLNAWKAVAGALDANSLATSSLAQISFVDPTGTSATVDLHLTGATAAESAGLAIAGITGDFDGEARAGLTPTDIGADAGDFTPVDISGPAISYAQLPNTSSTANRPFAGVAITDASGVDTSPGTMPRVYYKRSTDANAFNDNTSVTDGWKYAEANGGSSPFDFTLDYALLNGGTGAPAGTVVQYFVVAQDLAAVPNVSINRGSFASQPVSVALTAAAFPIGSTINSYLVCPTISGTKTICPSGCDFTSLTNAGGAFERINASVITGSLTVQITGPLPTESGDVALEPTTEEPAGSNYTITFQPSGGARTASGARNDGALIRLNGVDRVTIDGLNAGGNSLTITNTSTTRPTAVSVASLGAGLGATGITIRNCSISTGSSMGLNHYGISVGGGTPGTPGADNDDVALENNTITVATVGIYAAGTGPASDGGLDNLAISGNTVTCGTYASYGIQVENALNSAISQNTVGVASSIAVGISVEEGFTSSSLSRNTITGGRRGITVGTGTAASALTLSNNIVYGMSGYGWGFDASSMGIALGVIGNSPDLTTTTGGVDLYYNSVNMAGEYYVAANCRTTALYVGSGASAIDLRDNVLVNTKENTNAGGTGSKAYAIYCAAPSTAFSTIDYDDYFVSGTQGVLGYIGSDRTDLAALQAGFGQNVHSISADPLFASKPDLQPQAGSPLAGAGTPVAVTVDFTGAARSATAPTIGAYETTVDYTGPTIAYTPLGHTTSTANRVLPITVSDPSGVPTSGIGMPVLYFRKGPSGAFTASQSVWTGGNGYDCAFDYSLVGGVVPGDSVWYYVAAQDGATAPNGAVNPSAGAAGFTPNPPAVTKAPNAPSYFFISNPALSGTVAAGSAESFISLTNPGGVFDYINASVLAGGLSVDVTSDLTSETGAIALNQWTESGAGNYTLLIRPSGTSRAISGTSTAAALIRLNGADRVTIDGSTSGGTDRSLTIRNFLTTGTNAAIWIGSASASDGATNNTIKNTIITGTDSYSSTMGIVSGSGTTIGGQAESPNSHNTIQNNRIIRAKNAVAVYGAPTLDEGWLVTGNTLGSTVESEKLSLRGVLIQDAQDFAVTGNVVQGVENIYVGAVPPVMTGIQLAGTLSGGTVSGNTISDIRYPNAYAGTNGIFLAATSTDSDVTVANNFIYDVASAGLAGTTFEENGYGIMVQSGGGYRLYDNSVRLTTDQTSAAGVTAAINIASGLGAGALDIRDNIFANTQTVGTRYAIYCASANTVFSNIDRNDYFPGTGTLGYLGSARADIAAWRTATGQDASSISADPLFVSATDLHLQPCPAVSPAVGAGTPIAGITVDIDGNTRSATAPDMGADEVAAVTIFASTGAGGWITPSGVVPVKCGGDQSFAITPAGGYAILDVVVDGSSVGTPPTYDFTDVTVPHTISATFTTASVVGVVPDGSGASTPFTVAKNLGNPSHLDLAWGDSCGTAQTDFAVYEGAIGTWYGHASLLCSTGGGLSAANVTPGAGNRYYLIVPVSATAEGSYGTRSTGTQIPQGASPCRAGWDTAACP